MLKLVTLVAAFVALSSPVLSYECVKNATYDWPDPENCRHYFHCHNGTLEKKSCFYLFRFNPSTLTCRWWMLVNCTAQPFTPPPTVATTALPTTELPPTEAPPSELPPTPEPEPSFK
ncbi:uncharacterized protein LOC106667431 [Cimex lectularius]|uniref:Chitin-binding type-2 domain-containing protein n=1 Tax=Cimex lectularius TaxID=79782 RepID=A0A8I6RQX2_CIMLE|nr:uncharacterized protein LOC106667431 [Cimex lectularius]